MRCRWLFKGIGKLGGETAGRGSREMTKRGRCLPRVELGNGNRHAPLTGVPSTVTDERALIPMVA